MSDKQHTLPADVIRNTYRVTELIESAPLPINSDAMPAVEYSFIDFAPTYVRRPGLAAQLVRAWWA